MLRCFLIALFAVLCSAAFGQVIPPTVLHSAEAITLDSDRIVIGKVSKVAPGEEGSWSMIVSAFVERTIKGTPKSDLTTTVRGMDSAKLLGKRSLIKTKASIGELLELDAPDVVLYGADFKPIKGAAAIERRLTYLVKNPPRAATKDLLDIEFPRGAAPEGIYYPLLRVPTIPSVLRRLREGLASPDYDQRRRALHVISRAQEPILVAEIKKLLEDSHREPNLVPEYTLGYDTFHYPLREMAARILRTWKLDVGKTKLEERIWGGDDMTKTEQFQGQLSLEALADLRKAAKLQELRLFYVGLTRPHFEQIARLGQLRSLNLRNSMFEDRDLSILSTMLLLEEVGLAGTVVTDSGLLELAKLPSLKRIDAFRTQVTRNGLWRFHQLRPDVAVSVFEPGSVPQPISNNPLHHAAARNDFVRVNALLESNPELLNSVDADNRTALHYAACADALESARVLLDKGADPNRQSRVGVTPLHWALEWAADRVAMLLVQRRADIELARQDGEVVQLPSGARVPLSFSALTATLWDGKPDAAALMIANGANVNRRNELQWTPLMIAVRAKLYRSVEQLLDKGADVNAANIEGNTALHVAALISDRDMVGLLLRRGADAFARNREGKRAFDLIPPDK